LTVKLAALMYVLFGFSANSSKTKNKQLIELALKSQLSIICRLSHWGEKSVVSSGVECEAIKKLIAEKPNL